MSEDKAKLIYERMSAVMAEVGAIGKDRQNQSQNYSFRGIDDVYNAVNAAMIKHKVFCAPEVLDIQRSERTNKNGTVLFYTVATVKYRFYTEDGSCVEMVTAGEGMDSGDKSCNKAMSGAQKYAFFQAFCIPTEEKKDSEYDSHEISESVKPNEPVTEATDVAAFLERMKTIKNKHELGNWWAKHWPEIQKLEKAHIKLLQEKKNSMDADFKQAEEG